MLRHFLPLAALAGATALCGELSRAEGQAVYYRSIPIGERAIGLGGAFTGVANDPSATYYNPAGIVRGGRFGLLGSFTSIVFSRRKIDDAFDGPGQAETFTSKNTTTLPRFIGTTVKFGRKKFGDDHQFAIGYSTLETSENDFSVGVTQNNAAASQDLRITDDYGSRWYGVSFAAEVTQKSAVGFTIFLSDQSLGYDEDIGLATGGSFDAQTGVRAGGDSVTSSGDIRVSAYHFVPRLGWLHRINPRWTIGLMFQTPGIPLKQKGNVLRRITMSQPPAESTFFLFDENDLKAKVPIPFELRAGFGFQIAEHTLMSFDASITGPVKDQALFPNSAELAPLNGSLGTYLPSTTGRRWTPNFAIGAQHNFGKVVVAGGLFTNFSAAPSVPSTSNQFVPSQVNLWGASISVGLDTQGYRFSFGANGLFGKGEALAAEVDQDASVLSYQRTQATNGALVLYVAGAISIATKTAERLKDRRSSDKEDTDEPSSEHQQHDGSPSDQDQ